MEQGLTELRKIFIKTVDKVIEEAKNTNEVEASLPSVWIQYNLVPRALFPGFGGGAPHASMDTHLVWGGGE